MRHLIWSLTCSSNYPLLVFVPLALPTFTLFVVALDTEARTRPTRRLRVCANSTGPMIRATALLLCSWSCVALTLQMEANPIRKVVTLLQDMQKELEAEGKKEEELYT